MPPLPDIYVIAAQKLPWAHCAEKTAPAQLIFRTPAQPSVSALPIGRKKYSEFTAEPAFRLNIQSTAKWIAGRCAAPPRSVIAFHLAAPAGFERRVSKSRLRAPSGR
jgi:hypothetical protein